MFNALWKFARTLPGIFTIILLGFGTAYAASTLPAFFTGTASFGGGGLIDWGSVDASGPANLGTDPVEYNGNGDNLVMVAPTPGNIIMKFCITTGCGSANLVTGATIGASGADYQVPVQAVPSAGATAAVSFNAATPGPMAPCYLANGNACPNAVHAVYGNKQVTYSGNCTNNSVCTLTANSVTLSGNAQFNVPDGVWDTSCATYSANGVISSAQTGASGNTIVISIYNGTGGTESGSSTTEIGFYCVGQ